MERSDENSTLKLKTAEENIVRECLVDHSGNQMASNILLFGLKKKIYVPMKIGENVLGRGATMKIFDKNIPYKQALLTITRENRSNFSILLTMIGTAVSHVQKRGTDKLQRVTSTDAPQPLYPGDLLFLVEKRLPFMVVLADTTTLNLANTNDSKDAKKGEKAFKQLPDLNTQRIIRGRNFRWIGEPIKVDIDNNSFYTGFELDNQSYYLGDCAEIKSDVEKPFVAKLTLMWEDDEENIMVRNRWFYRSHDLGTKEEKEVFACSICDDNPIHTIESKCTVTHIDAIENLARYRKRPKTYYYKNWYDPHSRKVYSLNSTKLSKDLKRKRK